MAGHQPLGTTIRAAPNHAEKTEPQEPKGSPIERIRSSRTAAPRLVIDLTARRRRIAITGRVRRLAVACRRVRGALAHAGGLGPRRRLAGAGRRVIRRAARRASRRAARRAIRRAGGRAIRRAIR
ncbi:MAG TPA: hypothetical protein ENK31_04005, partial [Nannocystis exedens]|nr:hypothetical protein [Nannocystis exedens]